MMNFHFERSASRVLIMKLCCLVQVLRETREVYWSSWFGHP